MKATRIMSMVVCLVMVVGLTGGMSAKQLKVEETRQKGARGRITLRVVDQEGCPVDQAEVTAGFYYPYKDQGIKKSATDTNGICVIEGMSCDDMWYVVSKNEHYETKGMYVFSAQKNVDVAQERWQPWNPTNTVVLKRIKNPVAMYVKTFRTLIPAENTSIGFDLEKGDWIAPYGNGGKADLFFLLNRNRAYENDFECSLQATFPNEGDGLQEIVAKPVSEKSLRLPYEAPKTGYVAEWKREIVRKPDGTRQNLEPRTDQNYMFRVRTNLDEQGNVVSALYGKIYGDINYYGYIADKVTLVFTYYLNPTPNDRNIEFDPEKNLFGGRDRFAP
jgi:hypothetical protein